MDEKNLKINNKNDKLDKEIIQLNKNNLHKSTKDITVRIRPVLTNENLETDINKEKEYDSVDKFNITELSESYSNSNKNSPIMTPRSKKFSMKFNEDFLILRKEIKKGCQGKKKSSDNNNNKNPGNLGKNNLNLNFNENNLNSNARAIREKTKDNPSDDLENIMKVTTPVFVSQETSTENMINFKISYDRNLKSDNLNTQSQKNVYTYTSNNNNNLNGKDNLNTNDILNTNSNKNSSKKNLNNLNINCPNCPQNSSEKNFHLMQIQRNNLRTSSNKNFNFLRNEIEENPKKNFAAYLRNREQAEKFILNKERRPLISSNFEKEKKQNFELDLNLKARLAFTPNLNSKEIKKIPKSSRPEKSKIVLNEFKEARSKNKNEINPMQMTYNDFKNKLNSKNLKNKNPLDIDANNANNNTNNNNNKKFKTLFINEVDKERRKKLSKELIDKNKNENKLAEELYKEKIWEISRRKLLSADNNNNNRIKLIENEDIGNNKEKKSNNNISNNKSENFKNEKEANNIERSSTPSNLNLFNTKLSLRIKSRKKKERKDTENKDPEIKEINKKDFFTTNININSKKYSSPNKFNTENSKNNLAKTYTNPIISSNFYTRKSHQEEEITNIEKEFYFSRTSTNSNECKEKNHPDLLKEKYSLDQLLNLACNPKENTNLKDFKLNKNKKKNMKVEIKDLKEKTNLFNNNKNLNKVTTKSRKILVKDRILDFQMRSGNPEEVCEPINNFIKSNDMNKNFMSKFKLFKINKEDVIENNSKFSSKIRLKSVMNVERIKFQY